MPAAPVLPPHTLALPDGSVLHYTRMGRQGSPILLVHGSLCDYRYWRWQFEALSQSHQVIAPSLRGCWPDTRPHPMAAYRTDRHADDLVHLVRQLGLQAGVHVLGHSRGAQVAFEFARQAPDLCLSLTLADPAFRFDDEPETPPFYADTVQQLQAGAIDTALQAFIDTVNGPDTWRRMVAWFKEMARDNALTLISQIQEANRAVRGADVSALHCPVLLVGGSNSPAKYGNRQDRLQQWLPAAQRVRIALAAHGMNLANPRAFNKALMDFVA
ncbi:alpha/beta fold hydrolase [Castellaniella sp.]|uniref:alpha/beta fold hydrolase n=1 Tax=Castellaniella sp. TaxID=1955812 RepID=UPI003C71C65F